MSKKDEWPGYEVVEKWVKEMPMTMAAGIFCTAAKEAWKKGCFVPGGMANVCNRIERVIKVETQE